MPERGRRAKRVVAVGDLNGACDALVAILRGTGLVGRSGRWTGGTCHLIQVGDIFNRGAQARAALELLLDLAPAARKAGGEVTVLVGNHEVMTVLGNETYCTEGEYLSFASAAERARWTERVRRAMRRVLRDHPARGPMPPLAPRLEVWKHEHVPGRRQMRRALGARSPLGAAIRGLPIATREAGAAFSHAGITPRWARLGIDGLNQAVARAWSEAPAFYADLSRRSILGARNGPLWTRTYAHGGKSAGALLERSLARLGCRRMVIGHTQTRSIPGGSRGRIATRFGGRLVCIDVSLASGEGAPRAALVIEGNSGYEWTPAGRRRLWRDPR